MANPIPADFSPDQNQQSGAPTDYSPTDEEKKVIRLVEKLFTEAKKSKEATDRRWIEFYRFFRGKHWEEKRPRYRNSEVLNYIFSEVQTVLVLLTDNRPNIEVLPEDPSDLEFAEILSQILKSKWDSNNWAAVVAEAIVDAAIFGTAIGWVDWKPHLQQGLGDFSFETKDVFYCFPDPNARSRVNDEYCGHFILAEPEDVKKVKAEYPDKAEYIRPDLTDLTATYDDELLSEMRYQSPTDNRVQIQADKTVRPGKPNQVLKITAYLKSDELTEEIIGEEINEETGAIEKQYQTRLKFPNGRKICIANGVLLHDDENPYQDGKFPCARLVDHAMPREFWGIGEVEQLKSPNLIVDKLISYILDILSLMGNPIWKVSQQAQVDTDNLTNQPGLVVEFNHAEGKGTVQREPGMPIPPGILDTLQYMADRVLGKLGSTADVSKGVAPTDNASGYAIAQLQEAAQTKIRGKSRNLEYFLKDIGDLMVDRILQFYTIPRVVRLTNNQNAAQYFKFSVSDVDDESGEISKMAEIVKYEQNPLGGYTEQTPIYVPLKSKLDVRISVGSSLPFAKLENRQLAEKLFEKQIIDAEEYLTQIEYPNREKIIQRLKNGVPNATNAGPTAPNAPAGPAV